MPVFTIKTPEGRVLTIQAANAQMAMQGAQQWHAQNTGVPAAQAAAAKNIQQQNNLGPVSQAINSAANAMTFGLARDAGGAANAARTGVQNFLANNLGVGKPNPYSASQAYQGYVNADRANSQQFAQQHPIANMAAQVAGGIGAPGSIEAGKFMQAAPGVMSGIGRGAVAGAAMGGANAFGNAPGNPIQRALPTAEGAMAGGVVGGAIPAALAAVSPIGNAALHTGSAMANNFARRVGLVTPETTAAQQLAKAIMSDGQTPATLQAGAQNFPGVSTPTVADLAGENTRAAIRNAASLGPARNIAQTYRDGVAADLQDHAINLTNGLTPGNTQTPQALQASVKGQMQAADQANYPAFQQTPVPVTPELQSALQGQAGSSGLSYAQQIADAMRNPQALQDIQTLQDGGTDSVGAGTVDLIRQGLRDSANAPGTAGTALGSGLTGRAKDLAAILQDVPGFQDAVTSHANFASQMDAADHGGTGLKASPPDFSSGLATLLSKGSDPTASSAINNASGVGYRQALANALGAPTENAVGTINKIATSTNQGQNLTTQFGQPAADAYRAGLGAEADRMTNANFIAPNSNSATFGRGQDAAHFSLHGAIGNVLKGIVNGPDLTDEERQLIVNSGLATSPDQALIAALQKAQQPAPSITGLAPFLVPPAAQQMALPSQGPN